MYVPPPHSKKALIHEWHKNYRQAQLAHYEETKRLDFWHRWVGNITVATTAIAGTATFASLNESGTYWLRLLCGSLLLLAAVLTSIMKFSKFAERIETHKRVAQKYGTLKRKAEQLFVQTDELNDQHIDELKKEADQASSEAPHLSNRTHAKARREIPDLNKNENITSGSNETV